MEITFISIAASKVGVELLSTTSSSLNEEVHYTGDQPNSGKCFVLKSVKK
jgi:hypothetical protein